MLAFRIADGRHKIFDGTGAKLYGGRWNGPGRALIYAAQTYAGSLLEILVHSNLGRVPRNQAFVEIAIPPDVLVENLPRETSLVWSALEVTASRAYGDNWLQQKRSCVLTVPSVVSSGRECNVLINPEHEQFSRITASDPQPVEWDERFFRQ